MSGPVRLDLGNGETRLFDSEAKAQAWESACDLAPGVYKRIPLPANTKSVQHAAKQAASPQAASDAAKEAHEAALLSAFLQDATRARELTSGLPLTERMLCGRHRKALSIALAAPANEVNVLTLRGFMLEQGFTDEAAALILDDSLTSAPTVESAGYAAREIIRMHAAQIERDAGQHLIAGAPDRARALLADADQLHGAIRARVDDGRSLTEFALMEVDHEETLLGNRYLCRGGSMLFVGPSGIGKSSASCQQDMLWALGRPAFGIRPAKPLRILAFQAENDDGDQHEMAAGIMNGLKLTEQDMAVIGKNTRYLTRFETGPQFLAMMEREVERWRPDLIRLDPLNAYIGDDPKEPKAIAAFCRSGVNAILHRHDCGCVVAHHTPKTNFRDTSNWTPLEWAYAGAGGADLTNWARAVMVVDPVNLAEGVFRFIGAKRGSRAGWRNDDDEVELNRFFAYSRDRRYIYWRDAGADEIGQARRADKKTAKTAEDALTFVPDAGTLIGKATLLESIQEGLQVGKEKATHFLTILLEKNAIAEHKEKRSGKRDAVLIGRHTPDTQKAA